jgi:hypothetical protein
MSALTLSGTIFGLTLAGIFLGTLLRRSLPECAYQARHCETLSKRYEVCVGSAGDGAKHDKRT